MQHTAPVSSSSLFLVLGVLVLLVSLPATLAEPSHFFLTYGDHNFAKSKERIAQEAKDTGLFDHILTKGWRRWWLQ